MCYKLGCPSHDTGMLGWQSGALAGASPPGLAVQMVMDFGHFEWAGGWDVLYNS
jgi:hypothetical protein